MYNVLRLIVPYIQQLENRQLLSTDFEGSAPQLEGNEVITGAVGNVH